jgi:hypothetical protein
VLSILSTARTCGANDNRLARHPFGLLVGTIFEELTRKFDGR